MIKSDNYPVGGVIIFGGELKKNDTWLPCDGRLLHVAEFPELYEIFGCTYGGDIGNQIFNLPNYSGTFLRGASHESERDPDKHNRISLHPSQVNKIEKVGSLQEYATKVPGSPFISRFEHLPIHTHGSKSQNKNNRSIGYEGDPSKQQSTCTSGGDKETRPINVYVNLYVKVKSN